MVSPNRRTQVRTWASAIHVLACPVYRGRDGKKKGPSKIRFVVPWGSMHGGAVFVGDLRKFRKAQAWSDPDKTDVTGEKQGLSS